MSDQMTLDLAIEKAERQLARGHGRLALVALDQAAQTVPGVIDDPRWWQVRAAALAEDGRLEEAIEAASRGIEEHPAEAYLLLLTRAELLGAHGRLAEAEDTVRLLLREDPEDAPALMVYALILSRGGEDAAARAVMTRALQIDPDNAAILGARADIAYAADEKGADQHLEAALAADPENAGSLHLRAHEKMREGSYEEAWAAAEAAARLMPGSAVITEQARSLQGLDHWSMGPIRFMRRGQWFLWTPFIAAFIGGGLILPLIGFLLVGLLFAYYRWWPGTFARWSEQ